MTILSGRTQKRNVCRWILVCCKSSGCLGKESKTHVDASLFRRGFHAPMTRGIDLDPGRGRQHFTRSFSVVEWSFQSC